jgi:hypothetical protein
MPVLGQHHVIEAFGETIDDRHHGIAVGNRKRAAGAEIVLHIDYQQQIIVAWPDRHSRTCVCVDHPTLAQDNGAGSRETSRRISRGCCLLAAGTRRSRFGINNLQKRRR